jgi:SPP1 gp7 family putative phage head morphogenesis protein
VLPSGTYVTLAYSLNDAVSKAIERIYAEYSELAKRGQHLDSIPFADPDVWRAEIQAIQARVFEGLGVGTDVGGDAMNRLSTNYAEPNALIARNMQRNLFSFYAFKGHHQAVDIIGQLVDQTTGQLRSFSEFKRLALAISANYNVDWLKAEYDTAYASAQMADLWRQIQEDKEDLGMLQYLTVGDDRVRPAHAALDGTIKPADDPFWDTHFPPNGWRCRCTVLQLPTDTKPVEPNGYPDDKQHPPAFRNNPGKTGEVFTAQHPYFSLLKPADRDLVMRHAAGLIVGHFDTDKWITNIDQVADKHTAKAFKPFVGLLGHDLESGGYFVMHNKHNAKALADELPICAILKKEGHHLELLDESDAQSIKYDLYWKGKFWDIKHVHLVKNWKSAFDKPFKRARQKARILLHIDQPVSAANLETALYEGCARNREIVEVAVYYKGQLRFFTSAEILSKRVSL